MCNNWPFEDELASGILRFSTKYCSGAVQREGASESQGPTNPSENLIDKIRKIEDVNVQSKNDADQEEQKDIYSRKSQASHSKAKARRQKRKTAIIPFNIVF